MEIKIFNLKLKNFKGVKDLEVNFNGMDTNIYGANATGKTTVFDAFKWLFFDKDSSDRKDFNIKTLDNNNKPIHFLEHEVEATLIIDGQDITFKKMLQEKWVKRRGQEQQEFAGHETNYWIDEVPIKKKDYEEKINSIIPENLFKLITDPSFFNNNMSWKERRELLINISGTTITDEDILNSDEKFAVLKENLQGRNIEDYKKVVAAKIKELNSEKEKIPVRIDELTNTLITEHNIDYDKLEEEKQGLNQELQNIESEMTDIQARVSENMKKADQLAIAKNELHNLEFRLKVEHDDKYSKEGLRLNNEKSFLEGSLRNKKQELEERVFSIEKDQKKKEELYKQWDEVNNTKLEYDPNSFVCPTCKREYETDKVEEIKKKFETNLNEHKESRKQEINKEGQAINKRIEENTEAVNRLQTEIEETTNKLNEVNSSIENMQKEKEKVGPFDITTLPQYQEKLKELEKLQSVVDGLVKEDTTEIQNRKANITDQINNINKQLNEKVVQEKTKNRIQELENAEQELAEKIQELESQEFQIEQFTKTKVELLENAINSNFEVVRFRLFDTQINGGLVECCDTLVNGVPYSDVNNAHKIIAGLDIIKTLSKFYNTTAPIFIDNRESINKLCEINAQVISLVVTEDSKLRIEVI
ncbi:MAG: AAA family ATPase [Clostridia bacterium]|nr:AAA family ATPase [Clostridia bacterium]